MDSVRRMIAPIYRFPTVEHSSDVDLWLENDEPIMLRAVDGRDAVELTAQEARAVGLALIELPDLAEAADDRHAGT